MAQRSALRDPGVSAVVLVGPIGFVGLLIPHIAKILFGETGCLPLWGFRASWLGG